MAEPTFDEKTAYLTYKCFSNDCLNVRRAVKKTSETFLMDAIKNAKSVYNHAMVKAQQLPSVVQLFNDYNLKKKPFDDFLRSEKARLELEFNIEDDETEMPADFTGFFRKDEASEEAKEEEAEEEAEEERKKKQRKKKKKKMRKKQRRKKQRRKKRQRKKKRTKSLK